MHATFMSHGTANLTVVQDSGLRLSVYMCISALNDDALHRYYSEKKKEEGLDDQKDRVVFVADTCGFHLAKFIEAFRDFESQGHI